MRVCFVHASQQNVFFAELLGAFADAVAARGLEVETSTDCFAPAADDLVYVFVPHEYHPLVQGDSHPRWHQLRRTVAICTEQPGTVWFDRTAAVAAECGGAVDINELGVRELRRRGVNARLVPLGYVPAWDSWGGDETVERPIDLTFMGGHTDRRALALARCGSVLQDRRCALHVFETSRPHQSDSTHFLSGDRKWSALRSARSLLNVHRGELGYLEWQRVIGAMVNGCVVITEHSLGYAPLVAGEHFVSAAFDDLPHVVAALLDDPHRVAAIRRDAYDLLRTELRMETAADALIDLLQTLARTKLGRPDPGEPSARPRPQPPVSPPTPFERSDRTDAAVMRMALKQLVLQTRNLQREVELLRQGPTEPDPDIIERVGPGGRPEPEVSVVLSLYNYAEYVGEAIHSVARSDHPNYELVIVDDGSTDGSLQAARDALAAAPWLTATVIARSSNHGLAAARNSGLEHARAPYAFILDADNTLYPHALTRLAAALDADPGAAFAYGIIERFTSQGPDGLLSWQGWEPESLRYGNFVDAMALVRRADVLDAGGYTGADELFGWEDFALWCALADAGRHGVLVPEILSRYRTGGQSMISLTNVDDTSAWSALLRRYDVLRRTLSETSA